MPVPENRRAACVRHVSTGSGGYEDLQTAFTGSEGKWWE